MCIYVGVCCMDVYMSEGGEVLIDEGEGNGESVC